MSRSVSSPLGLVALTAVITLATLPGAAAGAPDSGGADLFVANCAGCHQLNGEGIPGTFPPLAGNPAATDADYVARVVVEGLTGTITVDDITYDTPMPPVSGLSDAELDLLVGHVVALASGTAGTPPHEDDEPSEPDTPAEPPPPPAVGEGDRGRDLFTGTERLAEGGGACASCHVAGDIGNLGGWSLGPDLTGAYDTLGGAPGLAAWLSNPPSETMRPIFEDDPMTDQEIADLVAFLADAPDQDRPSDSIDWLLVAGFAGLAVLLGGMAVAWRGMRQTYASTLSSRR